MTTLSLVMQFTEGSFYHIYNRGNNKQTIFFRNENYTYFLNKVRKYIMPNCDLLAWTLMPNHFHFLIHANDLTCKAVKHTPIPINALTEGIRLLLSSYSKGIQKQESLTGNLFQQKTKAKCVDAYPLIAFHYIHQNALKAKLVNRMEDWRFSSFIEYEQEINELLNPLCAKSIACEMLNINLSTFVKDSYKVIEDEDSDKLF